MFPHVVFDTANFIAQVSSANANPSVWNILWCVAGAGAFGGIVNALLSDNIIVLPHKEQGILRLGILANMVLGAFAGVVTWGLYGPLKDAVIVGQALAGQASATLTVTALVGAALAGSGGARVITSGIDKKFLRSAATQAATKDASPALAAGLATATPAGAASLATDAPATAATRSAR